MSLPLFSSNKAQPLEAWAGTSPDKGVKTRRRSAKLEKISSKRRSLPCEPGRLSSTIESEVASAQQDRIQKTHQVDVEVSSLARGGKPAAMLRPSEARQRPCVTPEQEPRQIECAVTTREQNAASASSTGATIHETASISAAKIEVQTLEAGEEQTAQLPLHDHEFSKPGSPKHTVNLLQPGSSDQRAVLDHDVPEIIQNPCTESGPSTINNFLNLLDQSSDSEMDEDSRSDVTATHGQEAINQLKAVNEDLRSEGKYYRLMAEITMKTTAVRRGYMRSPVAPSNLSAQLRGLHQILMSDGLKVPNSAVDRAHVLADVIQLHLTWEADNLQHSISASAAVNSFVEFVALFLPQIQGLAIGEFIGGEETNEVRAEISAIVWKLMGWIVEQTVILAETVAPKHLSYQALGWYDESVKALWDIDTCLEAAYRQRMLSAPEAKLVMPWTEVPGLYSAPIMNWASMQLSWVNRMAGRLQGKVDMVPNHYGVKVALFGLTRQSLENYLGQGRAHHQVSRQIAEAAAGRASASEK